MAVVLLHLYNGCMCCTIRFALSSFYFCFYFLIVYFFINLFFLMKFAIHLIILFYTCRWEHLVYQLGGADHVISHVVKAGVVVHERK